MSFWVSLSQSLAWLLSKSFAVSGKTGFLKNVPPILDSMKIVPGDKKPRVRRRHDIYGKKQVLPETLTAQATTPPVLKNYIAGKWMNSESDEIHPTYNPSTGEIIAEIPYATRQEVAQSVEAAQRTFETWSTVPILERARYLFKMKQVFEERYEQLAYLNSENHGKTLVESRGDVRRAIDNIDSAIAVAYTLAKGETIDQIAQDIDESMVREPLGVFSIVCPFNFPLMIPFWFIPYAIVLGDTLVVKPSELTPVPMDGAAKIIANEIGLPAGVLNLVHGGRSTVEALISDKSVKGVAFVGSSPVAKQVYRLAGEHGKRALVNGGAKNSIVMMPDANLTNAIPAAISSFFGNTGQRCLAGSNLVTIGSAHDDVLRKFVSEASKLKIGSAFAEETQMGPVVSMSAKSRIASNVKKGVEEGAKLIVDGREFSQPEFPNGFYLGVSIFDDVTSDMSIAKEEIFGPVASTIQTESLDEAIDFINRGTNFGNMASIFTTSGKSAREFRRRVDAGNIGINIGVASPAANFPFGGRRESFYGTLHAQIDTVDFFTDKKVIISRW
jgi:malonate-semialdehyde dehydrogenase (acetylating) / methylmalonate-semialdehyde dehydrogenase